MQFIDIVDFDFKNHEDYGFSKVLRIGKDISLYTSSNKNPNSPSILAISNKNEIIQSMRKFDFIYFPTYENDVELITSAVKKGKCFIISTRDILKKKGAERAVSLYRLRRFVQFCISYKAKFIIASFAMSENEIRAPNEIASIMQLIGLNGKQALKAMSWQK